MIIIMDIEISEKDMDIIEKLETGDILLFNSSDHWYDWVVKKCTSSHYSHTAMIVKDPEYTKTPLKGIFLIQSDSSIQNDVEDNKHKFGVQIVPINDIFKSGYDQVYLRKLYTIRDDEFKQKMSEVHNKVYNIPYDLNIDNWLISGFYHLGISTDMVKRHTDNFWCSALVTYLYVQLGLISGEKWDWSNMAPSDLADTKFNVIESSKLEDVKLIFDFTKY